MKIDLTRIPNQGLDILKSCDAKALELDTRDISYPAPIKVSLKVRREGDSVHIDAGVNAMMQVVCSRCLADFQVPLAKNFGLNYRIEKETVLDITDGMREEIVLGYPLKPLCRKDCKGICPICGKDLNKEECNCGTTKKTAF